MSSLANAQAYAASVAVAKGLREALDSRAVIDQAIGILVGENATAPTLAFDTLKMKLTDPVFLPSAPGQPPLRRERLVGDPVG